RPVREAGIRDVFDLAEALLDAANVQAALAHLDRTALGVLAAAVLAPGASDVATLAQRLSRPEAELRATLDRLVGLALLVADGARIVVPDTVTEVLQGWPE